jgi:MFS transporter, DHA3 family, tetracycline resistance protein
LGSFFKKSVKDLSDHISDGMGYTKKMEKVGALKTYIGLRFFSSIFFWAIVTVNLVYQATVVGLNPLQLVLVGTLLEFCTFVFEVPTGIVADLYSRKLSVIIGLVLVGGGFMIEGSNPTFAAVLIAQVVWGIGYTFISGAREAWIADEVGEARAGIAFMKGQQADLAGRFIGIAASMALANIDIRIPIVVGGLLYGAQALFVALFMAENNFNPTPAPKRETFRSMRNVFVQGLGLVRRSNVLLVIIVTGIIFGAFSEGFDRLWTPYMIESFAFPAIGNLKPVVWFGVIGMIEVLLSLIVTEVFKRRTNLTNHHSTAKAMLLANSLLIMGVIGFGFAQSFVVAVLLYWMAAAFRETRGPIYNAWANQNITPGIRATVLSMCSQADAIGQVIGGPILGIIAGIVAIRVSIIAAGLILVPTLFFYIYSIKNHKPAGG